MPKDHIKAPAIQLPAIIEQLNIINVNLFSLKHGVKELIEAVEAGDLKMAARTIQVYDLKTLVENLTTKD
jgi:hypothetical protein